MDIPPSSPAQPDSSQEPEPARAGRLSVSIDSHPVHLRNLRRQIEDFGRAARLEARECEELGLAVNEAVANIIRHAYGGQPDRPIQLTADRQPGEVRITLRDWSTPVNPQELQARIASASATLSRPEIRPGGLGLLCIQRLMSDIEYHALADGMVLTMVKRNSSPRQIDPK